MRHGHVLASCAAALLLSLGCQQAGRYQPRSTSNEAGAAKGSPTPEAPPGPARFTAPDFSWEAADPDWLEPPLPIRYVTADSDEWSKLPDFWNVQEMSAAMKPEQVAVIVGASPWNIAPLAGQVKREVKIKVPRGLDDPTTHTPGSNPPTAGKWQLGKELFFDNNSFLQSSDSEAKQSCASCHQPQHAFGSNQRPATVTGFLTPRLLNSAYATQYFWDGRAGSLEEAVQQSIPAKADTENALSESPHRWPGAASRLRDDVHYVNRFRKVFGTDPTQDAIAKALATYLRTLLAGNSVQDRAEYAMRRRDSKTIEVQDYDKALTEDDLKQLRPEDGMTKEDVARQLHEGRGLFFGKANCVACHGGNNYTDNRFHNLGIRESDIDHLLLGREPGRFATLPVGLKERRMIGAFKTPSLRSLLPRGPFTHAGMLPFPQDAKLQGKLDALFDVITYHTKNYKDNAYLDPLLHRIDLKESEVLALALYLKALEGEALPARVAVADEQPEKLPLPKK